MPRSVRVKQNYILKVKSALLPNGYISQRHLAEDLGIAQSTVSNFVNGKPVDYLNFIEISQKLGLDWQSIADLQGSGRENEIVFDSASQEFSEQTLYIKNLLESPEGLVPIDSPFYISRPPIEQYCYQEIQKPASLVRIKAPREMGKTSLLRRMMREAEKQGYATVFIDLELAQQPFLCNSDKFLSWFCGSIGLALKIPNKLNDYWDLADSLGSSMACRAYLEEYLLPTINRPLVLALDKVDRVFEFPEVYRDFFGLLRALHEGGKWHSIWKQLRLVIVHSSEVYVPMDINQSPFNVGLLAELPEFTSEQVLNLVKIYQLDWSNAEIEELMAMVGGHPFLIRLALYHIARQDLTLRELLQTAATPVGIYGDHLRRVESTLSKQPVLSAAMQEVVNNASQVQLKSFTRFKLHSMGLVNLYGDRVTSRYELYRQYFARSHSSKD
ncbi:MAG: AAA-like domain-containing protein [Mastigocoleus sp. MO_167.B18]|nr:AAA-like domain-containing protein [Mastigocoleus sp. MO_167.B18]